MFNDKRSKKIILVAHCLLNQNAISDGTADFAATIETLSKYILNQDVGIIQLPCPELNCLELDRGNADGSISNVVIENTRIRSNLLKNESQKKLQLLVEQIVFQIEEYIKYKFEIIGLIGINRSPSCGIDSTSDKNKEINGKGVFMIFLENSLAKKDIKIEMIGIKTSELELALEKTKRLFN